MKRRCSFVLVFLSILALAPLSFAAPDDYVVVERDTLFQITARLLGDGNRYLEIIELTHERNARDPTYAFIENPDVIEVGWKLAIPEGSAVGPVRDLAPRVINNTVSAGATSKGNIESIRKVDDYTVKITFYHHPGPLLAQLATPMMSISSPTAIRNWGREYVHRPVGTGPYIFKEWISDERIVLEANPRYWGEKPKIERLVYRVVKESADRLGELEAGTVDLAYDLDIGDMSMAQRNPDLVTYARPPMNVGYVAINQDWADAEGNKPFQDVRVRQAVAHAINKKGIVQTLYPGTGIVAKDFCPPALWGHNDDFEDYGYSPDRARELLTDAGYPLGFETTLWVPPIPRGYFPDPTRVTVAIQGDLRAVGIEAEIATYGWGTWLQKVLQGGEHGLCMLGWTPYFPDPDNFLFTLFGGATKEFADGPPDAHLYDILSRARSDTDPLIRVRLYYEAHEVIHGLVPGVPIVHSGVILASVQELTGFVPSPLFDRWNAVGYAKDTLVIARPGDSAGLDVVDEVDGESFIVGAQIYDSLVAFAPGTTHIEPALAERWEVSEDGLEWTFHLRKGVTFHDGTDFDADAVLFNVDRIWDKDHPYRAGRTQSFGYFQAFFGGFKGEVVEE